MNDINFTPDSESAISQTLSYPKRVEIWIGRLAMVSFTTVVAALVLNVGY